MQIACPDCHTSYEVPDSALGAGRNVRCTECRSVWFATAPEPVAASAESAPAPEAAPEPPAAEQSADEIDWGAALQEQKEGGAAAGAEAAEADASPSLVPSDETTYNFDHVAGEEDVEATAARRVPGRRKKKAPSIRLQRPSWPTVILSLLTVIGAILGWRTDVVRAMPQTASLFQAIGLPVNLRGLAFADITTTKEVNDGVPVLVVQGVISNVTRSRVDVPRLRFAMRDSHGIEVYTWTARPTSGSLGVGESLPFLTRLASPPAEGREVFVRFTNRRDR